MATATAAETLRIATFAAPLSRAGPGLLLRDILKGDDPQTLATAAIIKHVDPDILVLTDFDYDLGSVALTAFADTAGGYPFRFARRPNTGMDTGLDLDGNGQLNEARDAHGFGLFAGDGGMAILSRMPIDESMTQDFSDMLWADLPGATLPGAPYPTAGATIHRLSTTGHWVVRFAPVDAPPFDVLAFSATPPVFDGPEDRNGLHSRDELRAWEVWMEGGIGRGPTAPFVIVGNANLDPADGDGFRDAMAAFLKHPRLQDPLPESVGGAQAADAGQMGDPALDTADWPDGAPGNLRVSYVLPSTEWRVTGAGVFWPGPDDPDAALLGDDGLAAGPHRLVWVDITR